MKLSLKPQKVLLADHTTFKIGGPCEYFFEVNDTAQLNHALKFSQEKNLPYLILGQGSNLLISDNGFPGVVIKIQMKKFSLTDDILTAQAGILVKDLVQFALENGLKGLEWAAGLPGTLGGAVRGNAGAFRKCMSQIVGEVKFITPESKIEIIDNAQCQFKYRDSIFKHSYNIILEARLKLSKAKKIDSSVAAAKRYIKYRENNHPLQFSNAGSVFKNIEDKRIIEQCIKITPVIKEKIPKWGGKLSAGFLIESCGLKGYETGQAQISDKHANFIVNKGSSKAKDVLRLIEYTRKKVYEKFKVGLELEIQLVNCSIQ